MTFSKYYCYCPGCNKFASKADSLQDAKDILEVHEKECHKGKPIGTFGGGKNYPQIVLDILAQS